MCSLQAGSDHGRKAWWKVRKVESRNWMFKFESTTRWYDARAEALRIMRTKGLYDVSGTAIVVQRLDDK